MSKSCNSCYKNYENEKEYFHKRSNSKDGLSGTCKHCVLIKRHKVCHVNNIGLILCTSCKIYQDEKNFDSCKTKWFRKQKDLRCKECKHKQYNKRRISNRGNGSLDRLLLDRLRAAKERAKNKNISINITFDYIKELWNKQKGICAISGISMSNIIFEGRVNTNVSIDRIDSSKGYDVGNVQLVCSVINQMKSDLNYQELIFFCKSIINNG